MLNKMYSKLKTLNVYPYIKILLIPLFYALTLRFIFGSSWEGIYNLMSISFMFLLPTIVGFLSIYFSKIEKVKDSSYVFFISSIPVILFILITLILSIEGWPCILMIAPIFLGASLIGGYIGQHYKLKKYKNKISISLIALLPLLFSPIENLIGPTTSSYKAYTSIEINAPADIIWDNVTRVREIKESEDKGFITNILDFPRPIKAELNYEGVGAYRQAIFTNGLVFHETVTHYKDKEFMKFSIKALPHEIPLTTMDEHLVVGGKYFDVLNGTYELEKIGEEKYILHLYSNFKLTTTFNFYASWWANIIMKDIQENILQIQKMRSENVIK
jgi:hypothetical protein